MLVTQVPVANENRVRVPGQLCQTPLHFLLALTYCFACFRGGPQEIKTRVVRTLLGPCWHYVGSFFALGRLFFALGRLLRVWWACFPHVRLFFSRFGWLRVGFSGLRGEFGGSETVFFGVLSCAQVRDAKKLRTCENHSFCCVFVWFLHIASFVFKPQNNAKSFPGPVQQSFLQRLCSHSVLKWILEGFGALWGVT